MGLEENGFISEVPNSWRNFGTNEVQAISMILESISKSQAFGGTLVPIGYLTEMGNIRLSVRQPVGRMTATSLADKSLRRLCLQAAF